METLFPIIQFFWEFSVPHLAACGGWPRRPVATPRIARKQELPSCLSQSFSPRQNT